MTHVSNRPVLLETHLEALGPKRRGKVRDIYDLGEYVLLVAADRPAPLEVVLADGMPGRGGARGGAAPGGRRCRWSASPGGVWGARGGRSTAKGGPCAGSRCRRAC